MCQSKGKYDLLPRPNAAEPLLLEKGHRGEKVNCSFKRFSFLLFQDITDRPILSNSNPGCQQQLRPLRGPSELVAKIRFSAAWKLWDFSVHELAYTSMATDPDQRSAQIAQACLQWANTRTRAHGWVNRLAQGHRWKLLLATGHRQTARFRFLQRPLKYFKTLYKRRIAA